MAILAINDEPLRELALFAGAGGGILGGILLGWRTVCAVECNAYAASVLAARQNDGCLESFPIWDDVRTFDGTAWRGRVDVVSGGFPCQDISAAGKGSGIDGERSGLWSEMARIIGEVRPRFAFVENSPMLTVRGLGRVLGDLSALGYDARWGVFSACSVGAPHSRERLFLAANSNSERCHATRVDQMPDTSRCREWEAAKSKPQWKDLERWIRSHSDCRDQPGRNPAPVGDTNEMAVRLDRLSAIGNGQVPCVAKLAWRILSGEQ